jgi:hypothetical protein
VTPAPRFLTVEDVVRLHAIAIEDQGGDASLRDRGLLESAVAMPQQQFNGVYLHEDLPQWPRRTRSTSAAIIPSSTATSGAVSPR